MLGTFTHVWFFFVLITEAATWLVLRRTSPGGRRFVIALALSLAPYLLLWLPIALVQMHSGGSDWIERPGWVSLVKTFVAYAGGLLPAMALFGGWSLLVLKQRNDGGVHLRTVQDLLAEAKEPSVRLFLFLLACFLLVPFGLSQFRPLYVAERYTVIGAFPLAMLMGITVGRRWSGRMLILAGLLLLSFGLSVFAQRQSAPLTKSDRETAACLAALARPGETVICTGTSRTALEYHLTLLNVTHLTLISFPDRHTKAPGDLSRQMLADRRDLEREADLLVGRLAASSNGVRRLWVMHSLYTELNSVLKSRLERDFQMNSRLLVRGSYEDGILLFTRPDQTTTRRGPNLQGPTE